MQRSRVPAVQRRSRRRMVHRAGGGWMAMGVTQAGFGKITMNYPRVLKTKTRNARTCVLAPRRDVLSMNLFRFLLGKARLSYLLPYYRHVNIFKSRVACIVRSVLP